MDRRDRSLRDNRFPSRRDQESPSFSSTLLDSIYRSIDSEGMVLYKEKLINRTGFEENDHEEMDKLRRACLIEKWMEKKVTEKVVRGRGSMPDNFQRKPRSNIENSRDPFWLSHSSSTSSDSSSGSGFSSSEAESGYKPPKMIHRTQPEKFNKRMKDQKDLSKTKHENGYVNTKSKAAMKIFNDFKKSKQPLSPGGRLTSFINSLFTTTTSSKKKTTSAAAGDQRKEMAKTKYAQPSTTTTCSSASSFSRSCLSKTQSSREKLSSSKRSVKFCPVNIIVDEYYQAPVYDDVDITIPSLESMKHHEIMIRNSMREELKLQILERNRRVEEGNKKYHTSTTTVHHVKQEIDDDEEEDDAASCASSDLFELDSLSAIGMDEEELPVYETTQYLRTNRAIPNGFLP
ncbi:protein BIG GRAIN 1-like B [Impatiens glandulifera]|uniref:protein BIG GRAIN 1-like B n=1 Tax=Impatiens glandulifera TaxID=253017 RepID=UPI001FB066A0|nr:protein BIG GRAIN 1-like B [Impatiens glandulifera]